jgi:hypothetical protein
MDFIVFIAYIARLSAAIIDKIKMRRSVTVPRPTVFTGKSCFK